jgi:hypothetical protein
MILYHFTALEYLDAIKAEGLTKGEVPLSPTDLLNAVWLTADPSPKGHGLIDGRPLTEQERFVEYQRCGFMPPAGSFFPNKRAVRITVLIPSSDRNLYHWPKWGRKRLTPDWYERMDRVGSGKSKTWRVYFGTIPPSSFREIEILAKPAA